MKRILIDISNIVPGKGGAGGGVWIYAFHLLRELDRYDLSEGVEIICLKNRLNDQLDLKHIRVFDNPFPQNGFLGRLIGVHIYLPYFCLRRRVSLIHKVTPELPMLQVAKAIVTLHDFMFQFYLQRPRLLAYLPRSGQFKFRIFAAVARHAIRNAVAVIVPTHAIRDEMNQFVPGHGKEIVVTPEAAELPSPRLFIRDRNASLLRIIVVAGFYPHKGYDQVIELARYMVGRGFTHFKITVRGSNPDGAYAHEVRARVHNTGLAPYFEFPGFTPQHDLSAIYEGQDCFLLLSECEGFGLPVIEAQSYGLPVICSDIPVFRELLGDSAIFVNPGQPSGAFEEIKRLLESADTYSGYVQKGLDNVRRFSWNEMAAKTFALYTKILGIQPV